MPLSREAVDALTPEILPPEIIVDPPEAIDALRTIRLLWTQFMLHGEFSDRLVSVANRVGQAWYIGVGLVPWRGLELNLQHHPNMVQAAHESGYIWGGIILTSYNIGPPLFEPEENVLSFKEQKFPIVIRQARHEPEAKEIHDPFGCIGTAASWARKANQNHSNGCITAEHVVAPGRRKLHLTENGNNFIAKRFEFLPPCLDTAFVEMAWPSPGPRPYTPQQHSSVSSGDPVHFSGAETNSVSGFVTHVSAHAKYTGSGVPMILCHDGLGDKGDSGALVEVNGEPTAMHLGKIDLDDGGQESRGIFLQQICQVLDVELYL